MREGGWPSRALGIITVIGQSLITVDQWGRVRTKHGWECQFSHLVLTQTCNYGQKYWQGYCAPPRRQTDPSHAKPRRRTALPPTPAEAHTQDPGETSIPPAGEVLSHHRRSPPRLSMMASQDFCHGDRQPPSHLPGQTHLHATCP